MPDNDPVAKSAKAAAKPHPPIVQEATQDLSELKKDDPQAPGVDSAGPVNADPSLSGKRKDVEKEAIEQQLASARGELDSWEWQSINREDGSGAQDRRNEERGENLRRRIRELSDKLKSFE